MLSEALALVVRQQFSRGNNLVHMCGPTSSRINFPSYRGTLDSHIDGHSGAAFRQLSAA